jgi:hypothetical protein
LDIRLGIFIVIASILTMAVYSSSTNFVSGATECFEAASSTYKICISTVTDTDGSEKTYVFECSADKNDNWHCGDLGKTRVTPPGLEDAIRKSMTSLGLGKSTTGSLNGGLVTGESNTQDSNSSEMKVGNSPTPPQCPDTGPIPPDCTMKPPLK